MPLAGDIHRLLEDEKEGPIQFLNPTEKYSYLVSKNKFATQSVVNNHGLTKKYHECRCKHCLPQPDLAKPEVARVLEVADGGSSQEIKITATDN